MNESTIYKKLEFFFQPSFLKVTNDSKEHSNHLNNPGGDNSHFSITIKSTKLSALTRIEGQRLIFKTLNNEMKTHIHALAVKIIY